MPVCFNEGYMKDQQTIIETFEELINGWYGGSVSYDEVEEELARLQDDEEIESDTYMTCSDMWERAVAAEEEWQEDDMAKWRDLRNDQGEVF